MPNHVANTHLQPLMPFVCMHAWSQPASVCVHSLETYDQDVELARFHSCQHHCHNVNITILTTTWMRIQCQMLVRWWRVFHPFPQAAGYLTGASFCRRLIPHLTVAVFVSKIVNGKIVCCSSVIQYFLLLSYSWNTLLYTATITTNTTLCWKLQSWDPRQTLT